MQRIFPLPQKTAFFRKGEVLIADSISELGVYGTFLCGGPAPATAASAAAAAVGGADAGAGVLLNEFAGYLLRTKQTGVDEGGVATGYSVLSSIVLN